MIPVNNHNIVSAKPESNWQKEWICIRLSNGYTYNFTVKDLLEDELQKVTDRIYELSQQHNPSDRRYGGEGDLEYDAAEARAGEFVGEMDSIISQSDDAESVLRRMSELFKYRDDESIFDQAVAEAESLEELLQVISAPSEANSPITMESKEDESGGLLPTPRSNSTSLREQVTDTAKNADPAEMGKYTIGLGIFGAGFAISAPFSTVVGLGAIAACGAATGAYASANPNSLAAQIDPIELAISAKMRGRSWKQSSAPGGAGIGGILGALDYVGEEEILSAYSHWCSNADIDKIMKGAEMGAQAAEISPDYNNPRSAAVLGGGFGLAYGYAESGGEIEELEELLDDDLYEAIGELEQGDDDEIVL
jgi:hypothetical protein